MEMPRFGWSELVIRKLEAIAKGIGICNSMLVKRFRNRAIEGHWYPIVSIDCHKDVMTSMIVLRQEYALFFGPFDVRKPCQGMDHLRD